MKSQKNTAQIFVVDDLANTDGDKTSDLLNNELGIQCLYDSSGTIATPELFTTSDTAASGDIFNFMVKRADGSVETSDSIKYGNIESVTTYSYEDGNTQQVDYIGYDATNDTGSIDELNSNAYFASVGLYGNTMNTFSQDNKMNIIYKSDASASQYEVANGMAKVAYNNMKYVRTGYVPFKFEVVCDNAGAALGTSVDTLTFVKGSKYFTADDIDDDTGGGSALAVGDLIRVPVGDVARVTITGTDGTAAVVVGGLTKTATFDTDLATTAGNFVTANASAYAAIGYTLTNPTGAVLQFVRDNGKKMDIPTITNATDNLAGTVLYYPTVEDPVYKITALDTTNDIGTLDREYRGDLLTAEDDSFERIAAASIAAADFGLKISGQDTGFVAGYIDTELTRFYTSIVDMGDTDLSRSAIAASEDPGRTAAVAQLEAELAGAVGTEYRNDPRYELPRTSYANTIDTSGYDLLHIKYHKDHDGAFGDSLEIPNEIYIAMSKDSSATVANIVTAIGQ